MRTVTFPILAIAAVGLLSCDERQEIVADDVLARVGEHTITVADLEAEWKACPRATDPSEVLDRLIERAVLVEAARNGGIADEEEVKRSYENLLIGRFKERELAPKLREVEVSDESIADYYEKHISDFTEPARIRLAFIRINGAPKMSEVARARQADRAEAARRLAEQSFHDAAARYSDDQGSRYRGGEIGWLTDEQAEAKLPAEVWSAAGELDTDGGVSGVISSGHDLYLVQRLGAREEAPRALADMRSTIAGRLKQQARERLSADFIESTKSGFAVEVFADHLPELPPRQAQPDVPPTFTSSR